MEILSEFPEIVSKSKYDMYLDGQIWKLAPSDFPDNDFFSIITQIYRRAKRRKLKLQTRTDRKFTFFIVQVKLK